MTSQVHKRGLKTGNPRKLLQGAMRLSSVSREVSRPVLLLRNGAQDDSMYLDPSSPNPIHPATLPGCNIYFVRVTQGPNYNLMPQHLIHAIKYTIVQYTVLRVYNLKIRLCCLCLHSAQLVTNQVSKTRAYTFEVMCCKPCTARIIMNLPV